MRLLNWMAALVCAMVLTACGGGGGSAGTNPFPTTGGGGTTTSGSLAVSISSTNITATAPATVTFKLVDAAGSPVAQTVITIATKLSLGQFSVPTVLTDSNGVATAVLSASSAGTAGADTVTASATIGTSTTAIAGSVGFQVAGGGSGATPTLAVAISAQTITPTAPSTVTFTLTDSQGAPVKSAIVTIGTSRQLATFGGVATVLTNDSGIATALLQANASGTSGADEVVATAPVGTTTVTGSVAYQVAAGGTSPGAAPAKVELVASANTVGSGSSAITITAIVKGANNVAIAATPVAFSVDTGTLANVAVVTDANGAATAKLSAGQNKANRTATVTVTAGAAVNTIPIDINGTTLTLSGASTLALGTSTNLTIKAADSLGGPVSGQALAVTSPLGNVPAGTIVTTDSSGIANLTYAASSAGTDSLVIAGLGASVGRTIVISGQDFTFTSPAASATINIGAAQVMSVRYFVNGAAPVGNYTVQFTSTAGTFSTPNATIGLPLTNGIANATLSSNFAGPATIQATVFSNTAPSVSIAQATIDIRFVATTASSLTLQPSPTAIGPNLSGSTAQQSVVQATVLDQFKNPVANKAVNFSRIADPSGGNLSQASALTDANGVAKVQYISGAQSTSTNAVVLSATVADTPAVSGQAFLTVNQSALFIALGTGNDISSVNSGTAYSKLWTAYVTDSTGAAVPHVTLTVSALPVAYRKGVLAFDGTFYTADAWLGVAGADLSTSLNRGHFYSCANEDTDYTGVVTVAKDVNGDGRLEPGNVISVSGGSSVTTVQTDDTGFALITLEYAESYAYWVGIDLRVSATVAGTESSNDAFFIVPGLTSDYSVQAAPPAGLVSPFGVIANCTNPN